MVIRDRTERERVGERKDQKMARITKKEKSPSVGQTCSTLPQYVSAQFSNYLGNLLLLLSMSQQTTKDEEKKTTM